MTHIHSMHRNWRHEAKRKVIAPKPCFICGKEAKGQFCAPCSVDVTQARTAYRYSQIKKKKKSP